MCSWARTTNFYRIIVLEKEVRGRIVSCGEAGHASESSPAFPEALCTLDNLDRGNKAKHETPFGRPMVEISAGSVLRDTPLYFDDYR
jgi:hypothetical protein